MISLPFLLLLWDEVKMTTCQSPPPQKTNCQVLLGRSNLLSGWSIFLFYMHSWVFAQCTCTVEEISPVIVVIVKIRLRLICLPTLNHLQPLVVVETELLWLNFPAPLFVIFLGDRPKIWRCISSPYFRKQTSISSTLLTYSNNIKGVVTHFSNFCILVMHQINEVSWSLYKEG